jgi:hypothetical protein
MAELRACCRATDPGGADTACQKELAAHGNTTEPTRAVGGQCNGR